MTTVTIAPEHGILFILDATISGDIEIPEYVPNELACATKNCVSVGTRAPVDGETQVTLLSSITEVSHIPGFEVFEGMIETPGYQLSIVTSQFEEIVRTSVDQNVTRVKIWANDQRNPSDLVVLAR